jgi:hypothetical protein
MSTDAIVMLVIAILLVWGGLVVALFNLRRADRADALEQELHRDL